MNCFLVHNGHFLVLRKKNSDLIRSQFCTCHDSWAVVTCAKLLPDNIKIKSKIESCAHKPSVIGVSCSLVTRITDFTYMWSRLMRLYRSALMQWNFTTPTFPDRIFICINSMNGYYIALIPIPLQFIPRSPWYIKINHQYIIRSKNDDRVHWYV